VSGSEKLVEIPSDPALAPSIAIWSLVHGFARGTLDGNFGPGRLTINHAVKVLLPAVLASAGIFSDDGAG
jgi:hypothetical protein